MRRFVVIVVSYLMCSAAYSNPCNVSKPNLENPEGALRASGKFGWFGSEELAEIIPIDGKWLGMGEKHNYRNKFWWWYKGLEAEANSKSSLKIAATNLATGESFSLPTPSGANTGSDDYWWVSVVTILEFPSNGCWRIEGTQRHRRLTINLQVGE